MKKRIVFLVAIVAFFGIMAPNVYGQQPNPPDTSIPRVLQLDNQIAISVLESKNAKFGVDRNPPGGGGPAFYVNDAKVPNDIRYEIAFTLKNPINARPYNYIVFDMMGDTWEVMNDINEHYPRFRNGDVFVQFQGSFIFRAAIDKELNKASKKWVTVSIPIAAFNIHENRSSYAAAMENMNIFLLRFIANRPPIKGNIYFKNIRLQMEP